MSYSTKYRATLGTGDDGRDWTIDFRKKDYGGSITSLTLRGGRSGLPFEIMCGQRGHDVDEPLSESTANVYVVAPTISLLSDIESGEDDEFLCVITSDSTTEFIGLVEPGFGEKEEMQNRVVMVTAKAGLDWLANVDYPNTASGRISLFEHVRNCLDELPYSLPYYTIDRWFSINLTGDPFDGAYADGIVFKDGNTPRSCRYVLEQCLRRKGLNLRQSEGYWHIQQPDALRSGTTERVEYNSSGVLQATDSSYDPTVEYDGVAFTSRAPMVTEREALGQLDIKYNHQKLGDNIFENGDFSEVVENADPWELLEDYEVGDTVIEGGAIYEADVEHNASTDTRPGTGDSWESFWSLVKAADSVQPADWTVSDDTKARVSSGKLSIDAYFKTGTLVGNVDANNVWYVEQEGGSVTLNETVPGTLVFEANWPPGRQPEAGVTRPLPWTFKVGTQWWDDENEEWSGTKVVNEARISYAAEQHRFPMAAWPETGNATIRFYAILDDKAIFKFGGSNQPDDPTSWDSDLAGTVLIDNVNVELSSAEGIEAGSRTLSTKLDSGSNQRKRTYSLDIGQGPTRDHLSGLTIENGDQAVGWQFEDDFSGGSSGVSIDQFHGPRTLAMLRKPRTAKSWDFRFKTSGLRPHQIVEQSSLRYWPAFFRMCPYNSILGPTDYVRLRRDGETGLSLTASSDRTSTSLSGNRTQVFQQFDDRTLNTLLAPQVTLTDQVISAGAQTSFDIQSPLEEYGKSGAKIIVIDPDTAARHVLTLTSAIGSMDTSISFESYTFPKIIRSGAPLYAHTGNLWSELILTDRVYKVAMRTMSVGVVGSDTEGRVTAIPLSESLKGPIDANEELVIPTVEDGDVVEYSVVTSEEVTSGADEIPIVETYVNVKAGDFINDPGSKRSAFQRITGQEIASVVEVVRDADEVGSLGTTYLSGNEITSLDLDATGLRADVRNGDTLMIFNNFGAEEITVDGDQNEGAGALAINAFTPSRNYWSNEVGAPGWAIGHIREPARSSTSRITQTADQVDINVTNISGNSSNIASVTATANANSAQVVLKAESTDGDITKVALVQLDSSVAGGSALRLSADVIQLAGTVESADSVNSDGFVAGSSGWQIKGNGDAEFNNVTVRGTIGASTIDGNLTGGSGFNEFNIEPNLFKHQVSISVPSQGTSTMAHNTAGLVMSSSFGTGSTEILGGNVEADNLLKSGGNIDAPNLPTSDPGVAGRFWSDAGTVKVSSG